MPQFEDEESLSAAGSVTWRCVRCVRWRRREEQEARVVFADRLPDARAESAAVDVRGALAGDRGEGNVTAR